MLEGLSEATWIKPPKVHKRRNCFYLVHRNKWYSLGHNPWQGTQMAAGYARAGVPFVQPDFLETTYGYARKRAKQLGLAFELSVDDVRRMFDASKGKCSLSGLPFDTNNSQGHKRRPMIPSIDRIDPRGGYTLINVRLISFAMNAALNAWGEAFFETLARGFLANRLEPLVPHVARKHLRIVP